MSLNLFKNILLPQQMFSRLQHALRKYFGNNLSSFAGALTELVSKLMMSTNVPHFSPCLSIGIKAEEDLTLQVSVLKLMKMQKNNGNYYVNLRFKLIFFVLNFFYFIHRPKTTKSKSLIRATKTTFESQF